MVDCPEVECSAVGLLEGSDLEVAGYDPGQELVDSLGVQGAAAGLLEGSDLEVSKLAAGDAANAGLSPQINNHKPNPC